jgi:hypothetical protein
MKTRTSSFYLLLAPSRLVTAYPLLSGYDMGIATTAATLEFDLPEFDLDDNELKAVEREAVPPCGPNSAQRFLPLSSSSAWRRRIMLSCSRFASILLAICGCAAPIKA